MTYCKRRGEGKFEFHVKDEENCPTFTNIAWPHTIPMPSSPPPLDRAVLLIMALRPSRIAPGVQIFRRYVAADAHWPSPQEVERHCKNACCHFSPRLSAPHHTQRRLRAKATMKRAAAVTAAALAVPCCLVLRFSGAVAWTTAPSFRGSVRSFSLQGQQRHLTVSPVRTGKGTPSSCIRAATDAGRTGPGSCLTSCGGGWPSRQRLQPSAWGGRLATRLRMASTTTASGVESENTGAHHH